MSLYIVDPCLAFECRRAFAPRRDAFHAPGSYRTVPYLLNTVLRVYATQKYRARILYDSPVVSSSGPMNSPSEGNAWLSLAGSNYGQYSKYMAARVGLSASRAGAWVSDSSINGLISSGVGFALLTTLTTAQQSGTLTNFISYVPIWIG